MIENDPEDRAPLRVLEIAKYYYGVKTPDPRFRFEDGRRGGPRHVE